MSIEDVKSRFEIGVVSRPFLGEAVSGDHFFSKFDTEGALFAAMDGAGHGLEAFGASRAAEAVLAASSETSPTRLLSFCHDAIRSTRGAAISLARIQLSDGSMSWAGVGNVEGALLKQRQGMKRESLLLRNGVVGYEFATPRVSILPVESGDLLIFATDGVSSFFLDGIEFDQGAQEVADSILQTHGKDMDDALVVVIRMRMGAS